LTLEEARIIAALVDAHDHFETTINFYMDDDAWDALEGERTAIDHARWALAEAGYAHLV
jgi:hypothetical protein